MYPISHDVLIASAVSALRPHETPGFGNGARGRRMGHVAACLVTQAPSANHPVVARGAGPAQAAGDQRLDAYEAHQQARGRVPLAEEEVRVDGRARGDKEEAKEQPAEGHDVRFHLHGPG